jgi:shikimate kinase
MNKTTPPRDGSQTTAGPDIGPDIASDPARLAALAARVDRPIVLVGMMGVGKSTVGRKLAQVLDLPFVDADDAIVEAAKMSIADMFDQHGEASFRDGERRVIARLLDTRRGVIATGGGAFVQPDTRALIMERGLPVWLDCDIDTLVERVGRNTKRPLLRGGDVRDIVTRMKAEREPAYALAPIHVMSISAPHTTTVNRILEALDQCL